MLCFLVCATVAVIGWISASVPDAEHVIEPSKVTACMGHSGVNGFQMAWLVWGIPVSMDFRWHGSSDLMTGAVAGSPPIEVRRQVLAVVRSEANDCLSGPCQCRQP